MSPNHFVLAMQVLSWLLENSIDKGEIKYHWKCIKTKITHVCFVDDLMIFCKGELDSIQAIKNVLLQFEALSGLSPNPSKSNILFFCGVGEDLKCKLLGVFIIIIIEINCWSCWNTMNAGYLCVTWGFHSSHLDSNLRIARLWLTG